MAELTRTLRAAGQSSRLPSFVVDLQRVSLRRKQVNPESVSPVLAVEILTIQIVDWQARCRQLVEVLHGAGQGAVKARKGFAGAIAAVGGAQRAGAGDCFVSSKAPS